MKSRPAQTFNQSFTPTFSFKPEESFIYCDRGRSAVEMQHPYVCVNVCGVLSVVYILMRIQELDLAVP